METGRKSQLISGGNDNSIDVQGMGSVRASLAARPEFRNSDIGLTKNIKVRSSQAEAEDYLQKHKIEDVLSILTSSLVFTRPFNSRRHMSMYLKELKQVRDAYSADRNKLVPHGPEHPLFQLNSLDTLFSTADCLEQGHLTAETASRLAGAIGIDDPDALFENTHNHVPRAFFVERVHEALLRKTAAFHDVKAKYRDHL